MRMNSEEKKIFGEKLKAMHTEKGWSQSELAQRSNLNRDAISTYVRGKSFPSEGSLQKLAGAFNCTINEFLTSLGLKGYDTSSQDVPDDYLRITIRGDDVLLEVRKVISKRDLEKVMAILG